MMRRGFTLIEIMIVVGIMVALSIVALVNLQGRNRNDDLKNTTEQIGAVLREAESHAMAEDQGSLWGVHFSNATTTAPFYALYYASYATSTIVSQYRLPADVVYATSVFPLGSQYNETFSKASGAASASETIILYLTVPNTSSSISVALNGAVSY